MERAPEDLSAAETYALIAWWLEDQEHTDVPQVSVGEDCLSALDIANYILSKSGDWREHLKVLLEMRDMESASPS